MAFTRVAKVSDIEPGKGYVRKVGDRSILVLNAGENFYAMDESCPHSRGPLSEGIIDQNNLTITCTWHGAKFSLENGSGLGGPCLNGVRTYKTRICDEYLEIETD